MDAHRLRIGRGIVLRELHDLRTRKTLDRRRSRARRHVRELRIQLRHLGRRRRIHPDRCDRSGKHPVKRLHQTFSIFHFQFFIPQGLVPRGIEIDGPVLLPVAANRRDRRRVEGRLQLAEHLVESRKPQPGIRLTHQHVRVREEAVRAVEFGQLLAEVDRDGRHDRLRVRIIDERLDALR